VVAPICYIGYSAKQEKRQILSPMGTESPEPILMKHGPVNYVCDPTLHDNFGGRSATWVVWAYT